MTQSLTFAYEATRRLRVAFLGTSGHAFRNFLPVLPFAPVDLVALWDPEESRAEAFGKLFGAARWYTDLDCLFQEAAPEAVLIGAEGYEGDEPLNVSLMTRGFEAGCHVWTDKPLAASVATARRLIALRDRTRCIAAVGIKTMYYPAHEKVREILNDPAFGAPVSFTVRYPLHVPACPGLPLADAEVRGLLGHIWHPIGAALMLGPIRMLHFAASPSGGGGIALARSARGAVGAFHFSAGQAGTSPLERIEIVGEGANVVVENAVRLIYYRQGSPGPYGRSPSYFTGNDVAPLYWEPEMSLGQLYNMSGFFEGYAPSIIAFVRAALDGSPLPHGTLEDAIEVLHVFEALRHGPRGEVTLPIEGEDG